MRLTFLRIGFAALLACLLVACAGQQPALTPGSTHVVASASLPAPDANGVYAGAAEYRIGPLDLLTIGVLGVAELSQDVRVNATGDISLALIGAVHAGGETVAELQHDIATKLGAGYLQNPQVSVFIKEYTSQRVTVEGAVAKSGIFPLTGPTTLLQIIATTGGLGELADAHGVVVFRNIKGQKMAAVYDLEAIRHGGAEDPQIYGDDVVVVEESGSKSRLRTFIQSAPALGLFRFLAL